MAPFSLGDSSLTNGPSSVVAADINRDGLVDNTDITPFIDVLSITSSESVSATVLTPSVLSLAAVESQVPLNHYRHRASGQSVPWLSAQNTGGLIDILKRSKSLPLLSGEDSEATLTMPSR